MFGGPEGNEDAHGGVSRVLELVRAVVEVGFESVLGRICKFGKGKVSGGGAGRGRGGGGGNGFERERRWIGLREGVCFMDSMVG